MSVSLLGQAFKRRRPIGDKTGRIKRYGFSSCDGTQSLARFRDRRRPDARIPCYNVESADDVRERSSILVLVRNFDSAFSNDARREPATVELLYGEETPHVGRPSAIFKCLARPLSTPPPRSSRLQAADCAETKGKCL